MIDGWKGRLQLQLLVLLRCILAFGKPDGTLIESRFSLLLDCIRPLLLDG